MDKQRDHIFCGNKEIHFNISGNFCPCLIGLKDVEKKTTQIIVEIRRFASAIFSMFD